MLNLDKYFGIGLHEPEAACSNQLSLPCYTQQISSEDVYIQSISTKETRLRSTKLRELFFTFTLHLEYFSSHLEEGAKLADEACLLVHLNFRFVFFCFRPVVQKHYFSTFRLKSFLIIFSLFLNFQTICNLFSPPA